MAIIPHQFSMHFTPDTDTAYKNEEFEKGLKNFMEGFIECYPHLIEKSFRGGVEVWIFKFKVDG